MEIKKQITGMRRLLNDSAGRIYQRVGKEGEKLKEEPQDLELVWPQRLNSSAEATQGLHPPSRGAWNELPTQSGQFSGQYGTRSRTFQSQPHTSASSNGTIVQRSEYPCGQVSWLVLVLSIELFRDQFMKTSLCHPPLWVLFRSIWD